MIKVDLVPGLAENEFIDACITDTESKFSYGFQWKQLFLMDMAQVRIKEMIQRCYELDLLLPGSINWKLDFDIPVNNGLQHLSEIGRIIFELPTVPGTLELESHKDMIYRLKDDVDIRSKYKPSTFHLNSLRDQLQDLQRLKPSGTSSEWRCQLATDFVPYSIGFSWFSPTNPERRGMTGLILADGHVREKEIPKSLTSYRPFTKHT